MNFIKLDHAIITGIERQGKRSHAHKLPANAVPFARVPRQGCWDCLASMLKIMVRCVVRDPTHIDSSILVLGYE